MNDRKACFYPKSFQENVETWTKYNIIESKRQINVIGLLVQFPFM